MKNDPVYRPELLAPAGNLETAVAAFNAGADAVYLGLGKFNARHRAENFSLNDLGRLLDFAHKKQRKVYVTLNTLAAESELPELFSYIADLSRLPVDAVIVQDLGVLYILRKYFPNITVHASTQMGIHNSCGVNMLEKLGVKRVILERQITAEELRDIARKTSMELEVFVHGSLCLSLSGRCLLSNFAEEASGNRGMCRQLCRRNYRKGAQGDVSAALSPMDLDMINQLPELAKLKIASLKIEGRLRGPDYVVPVVQAYRKALDALPEVSQEAAGMIRRTVSRPAGTGAWAGFEKMISRNPQAVFGTLVGNVSNVSSNGLSVKLLSRIHLGDKLRLVNRSNGSLAGFELTNIIARKGAVSAANPPEVVTIPGNFPSGNGELFLYKIGENGYDCKRQAATLPEAKVPVRLDLLLDKDGLHITAPELPEFEFHSESFAPAERCAVSAEDLQSVFNSAFGNWRGMVVKSTIQGSWFCAKSALKALRDELFTVLAGHLQQKRSRPDHAAKAMLQFQRDYQALQPVEDVEESVSGETLNISGFIAEGDLAAWQERIKEAHKSGIRRFAVGGIHGIMLLKKALGTLDDLSIQAVYPLPAANSCAVRLLKMMKFSAIAPWVELPEKEVENLRIKSILPIREATADCELLTTRVPLKFNELLDKNQRVYRIKYDKREKLYKLYGDEPATGKFRSGETF